MMSRVARHVIGGLLAGAVVGYLLALVLPRRYPAPAGSYQAPTPGAGAHPVGGAVSREVDDRAVTLTRAATAVEAG